MSKLTKLQNLLRKMKKVAVAFSGGVDSSFLLKVVADTLGKENVLAVTAKSETYPEREYAEAKKTARIIGVPHRIIYTKELDIPGFKNNPVNRCYFCKKELFIKIKKLAGDGYTILDGTNYDDRNDLRFGPIAARELGVRSPLAEARLTKQDIRACSKKLGLKTWDKPALACLSSRFPYRQRITPGKLTVVERGEDYLKKLGFKQVRLRHHGDIARIEVGPDELKKILTDTRRQRIIKQLKKLGFKYISFDLEGYRTGSMNEVLLR